MLSPDGGQAAARAAGEEISGGEVCYWKGRHEEYLTPLKEHYATPLSIKKK